MGGFQMFFERSGPRALAFLRRFLASGPDPQAPGGGGDPFAWRPAPHRPAPHVRSGAIALEEPHEPESVTATGRWSRRA
jgi:hypothetical protein